MSTTDTPNTSPSRTPAGTSPMPQSRKPRRRPLARPYAPLTVPILLDTNEAADVLRLTADALRMRCRRAAVVGPDGSVTAPLGAGILGIKLGAVWRVRFDHPSSSRRPRL
jgi:hypothetical protein